MKFKSYIKASRKKSFASLFLAVLMMFSFNSSPIILLSNSLRTSRAYKSSETQTYYTGATSSDEKSFNEAQVPDSLREFFNGSTHKYNIYTQYKAKFDEIFKEKTDAFFANYENAEHTFASAYVEFLKNFNNSTSLSDLFSKEKDSNFLKLNLEEVTFVCLAETLAIKGFSSYNTDKKSIPSIITIDDDSKFVELSDFYRLLADYAIYGTLDDKTDPDGADHPNNSITTYESFYKSNTHYLRLKDFIDGKIAEVMPAYAFDGTTQDTNIAAIFAKDAPTIVEYNYVANSYTNFSAPSAKYVPATAKGVTRNQIYYFGNISEISDLSGYTLYSDFFATNVPDKDNVTITYYRPIQVGEPGYIDSKHPTYYKYSGDTLPYVSSNSSKLSVYVLNDYPTQSDLDTYASVYFTHITSKDLNPVDGSNFYVNIPLESDKIYFKTVYNQLLFSQKGFTYEEFENYFTNSNGTSNLYFKFSNKDSDYCKYVYIDEKDEEAFKTAYPDYDYKNYLRTFDSSAKTYKSKDYVLITGTSNSIYIPKKDSDNPLHVDYNLYFEKTKKYYEEPAASEYSSTEFEKTYEPIVNLKQQQIASGAYEPKFEGSTERKIYVLDAEKTSIELDSVFYDCIKQSEIDANPNFYVAVPSSLYPNNIDNNIYKLYYKHTPVSANMIFIVDNADSAATNKIYQTLNYNVISSFELEDNYSNYLAIAEGDVNYDKNYQLYYKYDRSPVEDVIYILKKDIIYDDLFESLDNSKYKAVGDGELSDYELIDKTKYADKYETTRVALGLPDANNLHLYYKLSNVFVQNALKDGNAIYVINTSPGKTEKEDYTQYNYTPISKTEVDNNPGLYVALSEKDPNWRNQKELKLYYKYIQSDVETRTVYSFDSIDTKASDFDKNAYQLIKKGEQGYKDGEENYYKKLLVKENKTIIKDTPTYYYFQTPKNVTLTANSYYAISFYVQTIGTDARASFYIKDSSNVISDIKLENISTNNKWEKYYIYLSTDINTASSVHLYLYLGDEEHGIKGNTSVDSVTAAVFFDEIKITKIGLTDFNKFTIDNQVIYTPQESDEPEGQTTEEPLIPVEPAPLKDDYKTGIFDAYNNRIYIANLEADNNVVTTTRFTSNTYDFRSFIDSSMNVYSDYTWNDMFNFDNNNNDLHELLGHYSTAEGATNLPNTLSTTLKDDIDGFDMYDTTNFTSLWRYYFSRDLANEFTIEKYRQAYKNNNLNVSITNQIEQSEEKKDDDKKDEDKKEEDKKEESKDIVYVSSPFNYNNYALKLENNHQDLELGITSNSFTVEQFAYYKITLWIYSPDLEGTATVSVNSVMKTRQSPTYGSLLTSAVSSTYANVSNSSSKNSEYGWIPVTLYIKGNNFQDMNCYLVLSAGADCTVYFDNIRIEKTTSAKYSGISSSDKYTCALSLTPSSSIISSDIKNGSFDAVQETTFDHSANSDVPFTPESWTTTSSSSKRVTAGIVSTQHKAFFNKYAGGIIPYEAGVIPDGSDTDKFSNIYAIYAPTGLTALDEETPVSYLHNYSISSGSLSLSANAIYQITFKFYKGADFDGKLISNLYLSSVKEQNIISTMEIDDADIKEGWQTYTFYLATGSSTGTAYIEIGVKQATGISYIKNVASKKITGKTMDSIMDEVAKENNLPSKDNFHSLKNIKFLNMQNMNFDYHTPSINEDNGLFDQKVMTDKTEASTKYTIGQNGVVVASYFTSNYTTTYSVTINKITYYIGEVYKVTINDVEYYIQKTYDKEKNIFEYTMYSDDDLSKKVTHINDEPITILTQDEVKVKVGSDEPLSTTTTYRLYRFSDLREEVRVLDGSTVSVPSLDKVIIGAGSKATENTATSNQNASYDYHFSTENDVIINNTIIPASQLDNAQSGNVLILSNSYSTDYIKLIQTSANTLGKSTYNVLRIYVKTSDFASDDVGLNIYIKAINTSWENINTTKAEKTDKFGFVCYEALIRSNSTDSIADFTVQLSLGSADKTCAGYAIISEVSLTALSSASEFEHYSDLVGDDNANIKKAIYDEKAKNSSTDSNKTDDENPVSWATFFYIFSSLLLVITMAVAMVAIILKKHPIKSNQKFANAHDRDIETVAGKKSKQNSQQNKKEIVIGEIITDERPKNEGGIE